MKNFWNSFLPRFTKDENGQVLPWMALLMVLFLGMTGLTIDLGRAYVCYRELQASTDAAALAGAYAMTQSTATVASSQSAACTYSSNTSVTATCPVGLNTTPNMQTVSTAPRLKCVSTSPFVTTACNASTTGDNVIQVTQTATIPTYFIVALSAFGVNSAKTLTLSATSSATLVGSTPPVNVAMVLDTTASMGSQDPDPNCANKRIFCALQGIQDMLTALTPCASSNASGTCLSYNEVGLFTFPPVEAGTAQNDYTCGKGNPSITTYTTPAQPTSSTTSWTDPTGTNGTYQITNYLYDYSSGGSIDASSYLNIATGASGVSHCSGMQTPGGDGTYYAGAINAAQTSLMAAAQTNPGQNVMIILSDGDANANSSKIAGSNKLSGNVYGSPDDQCQQAISAARNATALGTIVYTIAYGAPTGPHSGCSTDTSGPMAGLDPCSTMKYMSSGWPGDQTHFYSDTDAGGLCPSGGAVDLPSIFGSITASFSKARLIPNSAGS